MAVIPAAPQRQLDLLGTIITEHAARSIPNVCVLRPQSSPLATLPTSSTGTVAVTEVRPSDPRQYYGPTVPPRPTPRYVCAMHVLH